MSELTARILVLEKAWNIWGGLDPQSGNITDPHHPQCGSSISGRVIALPGTSGSSSGAAILVESVRVGKGPVGAILPKADMVIEVAALLAEELYGAGFPIEIVSHEVYRRLRTDDIVKLSDISL